MPAPSDPYAVGPSTDPRDVPVRGCGFGTAIGRFWSKYVVGRGRASRSEYWFAVLFMALLSIVTVGIAWIAMIIPSITLTVRRLHDTGRSANWLWLFYGASAVGGLLFVLGGVQIDNATFELYGDRYVSNQGQYDGGRTMVWIGLAVSAVGGIAQFVCMCQAPKPAGDKYAPSGITQAGTRY